MYQSDLIIDGIQADKLMALQLEKALSGVKDQALEQASKIGDGATRLMYYTSCFTDNYQDVCAKLKEEDLRFIEGVMQLIGDRNIIYRMIHIYFENIFKQKTNQQLEYIKWKLFKAGVNISASSMTSQAFVLGITTSVCLGVSFNTSVMKWASKSSSYGVIAAGLYGYVQQASESAERLKLINPDYYHLLFIYKLEMMYFLVEPAFMKAQSFRQRYPSDDDIINTIISMVK